MSAAESPSRFTRNLALHDAVLQLQPEHQEDFQRLVKVLTQIHGFRLYFAQVDDIGYRDQVITQLNLVLAQDGKTVQTLDLSTFTRTLPFDEFESIINAQPVGTVMHLLNSEVWLAQHAAQLNIRRNAIATHSQCALLWWLPHSAVARIATEAPDVWSWRHGVFGFAMSRQAIGFDAAMLAPIAQSGPANLNATTLPQKSKRLASLRQLLEQEISDDLRFPLLIEMADLLALTGHANEALRCLHEQVLPLLEKAGAVFERARIIGRIAGILESRGELDEAERLRRCEELPVFEKLGEFRALANARSNLAVNLALRGKAEFYPEIATLLRQAYALTKRHGLPETLTIEQIYQRIFGKSIARRSPGKAKQAL
ncbi:MAG: hypothetical protein RL748_231 [Pseudomonadota bacterium]|jgi:hypothetical protein